jgi:hypothetical protein
MRQAALDSDTKPGEQSIKHIDKGEALVLEGMERDDDPDVQKIKQRGQQLLDVIPDDTQLGRTAHAKVIEGMDLGIKAVRIP